MLIWNICNTYVDGPDFIYARIAALDHQPAAGEASWWVPSLISTRLEPRLESDHDTTDSS